MSEKSVLSKIKTILKKGADKVSAWYKTSFKPELLEFLEENKGLALKVVQEVAGDLVDYGGEVKRAEAVRRITAILVNAVPSVKLHSSWLNLLVELAVSALKAQGRL